MINIKRTETPPASLKSPDIQAYLDVLEDYKKDPVGKEKPKRPPSYRNSDLLKAFDECFFGKCYLTEQWFVNSYPMDVEHFISKDEKPELRYEWTNLFPSEHKANMAKPRQTPNGGYLDPCKVEDDVEKDILYSLSVYGNEPRFKAAALTNVKAVNTADLLKILHNGKGDEESKKNTEHLRFEIQKKFIEVHKAIIQWQRQNLTPQEKFQAEEDLKTLLSRKSAFTMLMRSIPAVLQNVPADLLD